MASQIGKSNGINSKLVTPKRKLEILQKREQVASLLGQGYSVKEIADKVGIYWSGVYKIIEKMSAQHHKRVQNGYDHYIVQIEAGYKKVLCESWQAWERSKCDHEGKPRQPNVLYMDRVLATYEAIRKLHGLDKITPKEDQNNNTKGALDWDSLVANRSLSSVTVNINGQTPNGSTNNNHPDTVPSTAMVHSGRDNNVPNSNIIVEEFKDAIEDRIAELHRRAEAKAIRDAQQDTTVSSLQDATGGQVSQPPPTVKRVIKVKRVTPIKKTIIIQSDSPL